MEIWLFNGQVSVAWSIALHTQELYTRPRVLKERWREARTGSSSLNFFQAVFTHEKIVVVSRFYHEPNFCVSLNIWFSCYKNVCKLILWSDVLFILYFIFLHYRTQMKDHLLKNYYSDIWTAGKESETRKLPVIPVRSILRKIQYCIYRPYQAKRRLRACAKRADSDHPAHAHSTVSNDSLSGQRRPWSACAYAQADLGLPCPYMPKDMFSHGVAQIGLFIQALMFTVPWL